jgi:hypothetical protein
MEPEAGFCQYYYDDIVSTTSPDSRVALPLRKYWWTLKRHVWHMSILGGRRFFLRVFPSTPLGLLVFGKKKETLRRVSYENLKLQPGEWVEVRSLKEIFATLDAQGKLKGLRFNKEMARFCGGRFRVYKRLDKMILESTGELRKIRTPTVLLEGIFCDGKEHGGCDRSCFCFWREAWLKRVQ